MRSLSWFLALVFLSACGGSEADRLGVGAACTDNADCNEDMDQECLRAFKGGYCGIQDCVDDADCPEDSACVVHDNGTNYCFRTCVDKAECNANRDEDVESNCSANVNFVEDPGSLKACVPPSN